MEYDETVVEVCTPSWNSFYRKLLLWPIPSSFFQFLPLQVEETYFFRDGLNQGLIRFLPPGGRNLPTLHVMAWCQQATSNYLSHRWPKSMLPYDITRPQWVKSWFYDYTQEIVTYTAISQVTKASHQSTCLVFFNSLKKLNKNQNQTKNLWK